MQWSAGVYSIQFCYDVLTYKNGVGQFTLNKLSFLYLVQVGYCASIFKVTPANSISIFDWHPVDSTW
jgi:hypothetical protein